MKITEEKRKTIIQFIKFSLIGILTTAIQVLLVSWLYHRLKWWKAPLPHFMAPFFNPATIGPGHTNWGYVLPLIISLALTNILSYFLNKKATFRSDAPTWHFWLYLLIITLLTLLCTWIQGVLINALIRKGHERIAPGLAAIVAAIVQGLILFPIQKYVLLREKRQ
jgi:putative flippase GtrA